MKVLTVIENYDPFIIGGAEITIESYVKFISSEYKANFKVLTGEHTKINNYSKLNYVSRDLKGVDDKKRNLIIEQFNLIYNIFVFLKNVFDYKPDIIEIVPNNYSLYPIIYVSTLLKFRIAISVHNHSFYENVPSLFGWLGLLKRKIVHNINHSKKSEVITISKYMRDGLLEAGFSKDTVTVLNNPIDKAFPEKKSENYAVFASRLVPEKGIEYVLKAFAQLPEFQLKVFGDGTLVKVVEQYQRDFPNIRYYGKVSEDEVVSSVENCFCLVAHPLFEEPFGRYILHSFSTLKPLICTYSGAVPELIKDHYSGILIKKRDVNGMVKAIQELQNDKRLYSKIVHNLLGERNKYSLPRLAKRKYELWHQILLK